MEKAYFDCFAGASGDMIIGAFIDSGLDFQLLMSEISKLNISGYTLSCTKCSKNGITATKFNVDVTAGHHHRPLSGIINLIETSKLHRDVKDNAISIFNILGRAEAHVHNTDIESVHFHEVGAFDSIIDICGAAVCFHESGIKSAESSPLNTGSGFVKSAHGMLPVPAPATVEILKGIPVYSNGTQSELTTPTGAAILRHYCTNFTQLPSMRIESAGYGAGTKDLDIPNVIRLFTGTVTGDTGFNDEICEMETSVDDMNPEIYSYLFEQLLAAGALDVSVIPAVMKKNRPGHILKVLSAKENSDNIAIIILRETTTSGVRINPVMRRTIARTSVPVGTKYGEVRVKIHRMGGMPVTVSPEYEDCRRAASEYKIPLKDVYMEALMKAQTLL